MVWVSIGPRRVLVLNDPDLILQVLFDQLRENLGNGLVTSAGDFHHRQRRLIQPAFHSSNIIRYSHIIGTVADNRVGTWRPAEPLEMTREIHELVTEILLKILFDPMPDASVVCEIHRWLGSKQEAMKQALSPVTAWLERLHLAPKSVTPPRDPYAHQTDLFRTLRQLVRRRRSDMTTDDRDLLSMLCMASHPATGLRMSDDEICDEFVDPVRAGTGTVSAALSWALHEIATRPDVQEELQAEVDSQSAAGKVIAEIFPNLAYTRRVAKEVLRQRPVWLLMRRVTSPVGLAGHRIDVGTEIFFSPYAVHHDPRYYADPDNFDPNRWLPANCADLPRGAFLPFGSGKRLCIGEELAWSELVVILATVVARWTLTVPPGSPVRARIGTVLRPEKLWLTPVPRH
jgi:cytochrome P450